MVLSYVHKPRICLPYTWEQRLFSLWFPSLSSIQHNFTFHKTALNEYYLKKKTADFLHRAFLKKPSSIQLLRLLFYFLAIMTILLLTRQSIEKANLLPAHFANYSTIPPTHFTLPSTPHVLNQWETTISKQVRSFRF